MITPAITTVEIHAQFIYVPRVPTKCGYNNMGTVYLTPREECTTHDLPAITSTIGMVTATVIPPITASTGVVGEEADGTEAA